MADAGRNGRESRSRPAGRRRGGQRTLHGAHPAADPHGVERGRPVRRPRHADLRQPPDARAGLQGPRHEIPADHHHPGPDADLHQRRQVFGQKPESRLPAQRPRGRMDTRHGGPAESHGHDPHARQMRRQEAGARTDGARAPFAFGMGRRGRQPAPRADARRLRVEGVGRSPQATGRTCISSPTGTTTNRRWPISSSSQAGRRCPRSTPSATGGAATGSIRTTSS